MKVVIFVCQISRLRVLQCKVYTFGAQRKTNNNNEVPVLTEALEGHFSYHLQLICYSLIVIT